MRLLKYHEVEKKLTSLNKKLFTVRDLEIIFGSRNRATQAFVENNVKRGNFTRIKRGLYAFSNQPPNDFYLANHLYQPSYLSLETACSYYGLIPESVYAVSSITTKPTREFKINGRAFVYRKIKREAFTGFVPRSLSGQTIHIATPEKALVDLMYFIFLEKRPIPDRLNRAEISPQKLSNYLRLFKNPRFVSFSTSVIKTV